MLQRDGAVGVGSKDPKTCGIGGASFPGPTKGLSDNRQPTQVLHTQNQARGRKRVSYRAREGGCQPGTKAVTEKQRDKSHILTCDVKKRSYDLMSLNKQTGKQPGPLAVQSSPHAQV